MNKAPAMLVLVAICLVVDILLAEFYFIGPSLVTGSALLVVWYFAEVPLTSRVGIIVVGSILFGFLLQQNFGLILLSTSLAFLVYQFVSRIFSQPRGEILWVSLLLFNIVGIFYFITGLQLTIGEWVWLVGFNTLVSFVLYRAWSRFSDKADLYV